jgi:hypothetical protein
MIHLAFLNIFWHPLGQCAGNVHEVARCKSYNWWSGIAADFGEIALFGILITGFRHFNCHVNSPHFCWRFGHPVVGTSFRACKRHHPGRESSGKVTAEHINHAHNKHVMGSLSQEQPKEDKTKRTGRAVE